MHFIDLASPTDWLRVCTRGAVVTRWATSSKPVRFPIPAPELNAAGFEKNIPYEGLPDGAVDVLDGYHNRSEVKTGDGYRSAVLAPWSNRISGAIYTYNERVCDLGPDEEGRREALHGLAADAEFNVVRVGEDFVDLEATIGGEAGYPWALLINVGYVLRRNRVEVSISAENISAQTAPVTLGLHPYFRYRGGTSKGARVFVPAKTRVVTDMALIPTPGKSAFVPAKSGISGAQDATFAVCGAIGDPPDQVKPIRRDAWRSTFVGDCGAGAHFQTPGVTLTELVDLDDAFTELAYCPEGATSAVLTHANGDWTVVKMHAEKTWEDLTEDFPQPEQPGGVVSVEPKYSQVGEGIIHVYTGEALKERATESIAIETCQAMTNAFNRDERDCGLAPGDITHLEVEWGYRFAAS